MCNNNEISNNTHYIKCHACHITHQVIYSKRNNKYCSAVCRSNSNKKHNCIICNNKLDTRKRYCSENCRMKAVAIRRGDDGICKHCGKLFYNTCKTKYCSDKCKKEASIITKTCIGCNTEYKIKRGTRSKYCTNSCMLKNRTSGIKHGHFRNNNATKEYRAWNLIMTVCTNKNVRYYKTCNAKGIKFDISWKEFSNFLNDVGYAPTAKHRLIRIDTNKDFCKDNCKWDVAKSTIERI